MKKIENIEAMKFLIDSGILFEINRVVMNPLGLSFIVSFEDNEYKFNGIMDNRDNVAANFSQEQLEAGFQKFNRYLQEKGDEAKNERYGSLGYVVQELFPNVIFKKRSNIVEE